MQRCAACIKIGTVLLLTLQILIRKANNMLRKNRFPRQSSGRALALLAVSSLLLTSVPVFGEDGIMIDDSPDLEEPAIMIPEESSSSEDALDSSGLFIEDSGSGSQLEDGISMEDVEAEEPITELIPEIDLIDADVERIRAHLEKLTATEDPTGSEGELTIAAYITEQMKALGYTVEGQAFHEGFLNVNGIDAPGVNLIAERGADSQEGRTRDIFLVVTHYDSKTAAEEGDPYANDKSGVVVLLEAARILAQEETDTDLCFLFLSGQEDGGYGAQAFVDTLKDDLRNRITGVLAVDYVGYDTGMPNIIKTASGEANRIASLVQEEGLWQEARMIVDGIRPMPQETADTSAESDGIPTESDGIPAEADGIPSEEASMSGSGFVTLEDAGNLSGDSTQAPPETEEPDRVPAVWSCLADPHVVSEDADPVNNPDLHSIQSIFANAQFTAAQISQSEPDTDRELYLDTIEKGLADTTADRLMGAIRQVQNDGIYESIDTFNEIEIVGLEDVSAGILSEDTAMQSVEAGEQTGMDGTQSDMNGIPESETESEVPLPSIDPLLLAQNADILAQTLMRIMGTE